MYCLNDDEKKIFKELVKVEIENLRYYDRLGDLDISGHANELEYMQLIDKIRGNHELERIFSNYFIIKGISTEFWDYCKLLVNDFLLDDFEEFEKIVINRLSNYVDTNFLEYKNSDTGVIDFDTWKIMRYNVLTEVMACDVELVYIEELLRFGRFGYNNFVKMAYLEIYQHPLVENNLLFRNFNFDIFRELNYYDCGEIFNLGYEDYFIAVKSLVLDLRRDIFASISNKEKLTYLEKEELFCKIIGYYKIFDIDTIKDLNIIVDMLQINKENNNILSILKEALNQYQKTKKRYK